MCHIKQLEEGRISGCDYYGGRLRNEFECYTFEMLPEVLYGRWHGYPKTGYVVKNIEEIQKGPLGKEEYEYMCRFGDTVYKRKKK